MNLVLDGVVLVARALGATEIHVVAPAGTPPGLAAAVRERDGRREPARMIHSATVLFAEELYDHAHHGSCRACATGAPAGRTRRTVPA